MRSFSESLSDVIEAFFVSDDDFDDFDDDFEADILLNSDAFADDDALLDSIDLDLDRLDLDELVEVSCSRGLTDELRGLFRNCAVAWSTSSN